MTTQKLAPVLESLENRSLLSAAPMLTNVQQQQSPTAAADCAATPSVQQTAQPESQPTFRSYFQRQAALQDQNPSQITPTPQNNSVETVEIGHEFIVRTSAGPMMELVEINVGGPFAGIRLVEWPISMRDSHGYFPHDPEQSGAPVNQPAPTNPITSAPNEGDTGSSGAPVTTAGSHTTRRTTELVTSRATMALATQSSLPVVSNVSMRIEPKSIASEARELFSLKVTSLGQNALNAASANAVNFVGLFAHPINDWTSMIATNAAPVSAMINQSISTSVAAGARMAKSIMPRFVPEHLFHIAQLPNPLVMLNDSLSNFADQAAATASALAKAPQTQSAAYITVAVIAADVAILTYYVRNRPRRKNAQVHAFDQI